MTDAVDKLPPHNLEAEQSVLGSLLIDRDAVVQVMDYLSPNDFFHGANGTIFRAIVALFKARIPADFITLTDFLKKKGQLDNVGGVAYVSSLLSTVPTSVHLMYYAKIVRDNSYLRTVIDYGAEMVSRGYTADTLDVEDLINELRDRTARFHDPGAVGLLANLMEKHRERTLLRWNNKLDELVVPAGIQALDRDLYGGFRAGDLVFIAGRPGMGKTSYAVRLALEAAITKGLLSVFFELEMATEPMLNRIISQASGIPFGVAYHEVGDSAQRSTYLETSEDLEKVPFVLVGAEDAPTTVGRIAGYCERLRTTNRLGPIVIDHMDYISDSVGGDNREYRTSEITRRLKRMAVDLRVPVFILSQLTREVEDQRNSPFMPALHHLKGSGAMEGITDYALLAYRRMYYVEKGRLESDPAVDYIAPNSALHTVDMNLAKSRNGQVRNYQMGWDGKSMRFIDAKIA